MYCLSKPGRRESQSVGQNILLKIPTASNEKACIQVLWWSCIQIKTSHSGADKYSFRKWNIEQKALEVMWSSLQTVFLFLLVFPTIISMPSPLPTTTRPGTISTLQPDFQAWIQPSSTKTSHLPSPARNTSRPISGPVDCACSLPFHLFIECHIKKVEHCKARSARDTRYSEEGPEISYDYSWPYSMKHFKYDPSGQLSLSVALMELLRNSILQQEIFSEPLQWGGIYRDLHLPPEQTLLQDQPNRKRDMRSSAIKKALLKERKAEDSAFQNEPTGQMAFSFGEENSQWNSDSDFLGFDSSSKTQGSVREGLPRGPLGDVHQLRLSNGNDGLSLPHSRRGGKRIKSKLRLL